MLANRIWAAFVKSIWERFSVTGLPVGDPKLNVSWGLVDYDLANSAWTADVILPGVEISIPFKILVLKPSAELIAAFGKTPSDVPDGTCLFSLNNAGEGPDVYVLGIPFFQFTYPVSTWTPKRSLSHRLTRVRGPVILWRLQLQTFFSFIVFSAYIEWL
jgi:hypothetical protein